jgi:hypothetical protein
MVRAVPRIDARGRGSVRRNSRQYWAASGSPRVLMASVIAPMVVSSGSIIRPTSTIVPPWLAARNTSGAHRWEASASQ